MLIFWRLLLGHLLADFTFQSNFINAWKRRSTWGMVAHCAMHPLAYSALCYPYLNHFWVDTAWLQLRGWTCVLLIFILHFIEDEWRVFTIFRFRAPDNTLYFAWDQLIHFACIFLFVPRGLIDGSTGLVPEKWPVLGCLLVGATHFCTVLVYFLEKDLFSGYFPEFDEKYLTMAERLVLSLCFLLPGWWWLPLAAAWVGSMYYLRLRRLMDYSWFSFFLGTGMAVACGTAARFVFQA